MGMVEYQLGRGCKFWAKVVMFKSKLPWPDQVVFWHKGVRGGGLFVGHFVCKLSCRVQFHQGCEVKDDTSWEVPMIAILFRMVDADTL